MSTKDARTVQAEMYEVAAKSWLRVYWAARRVHTSSTNLTEREAALKNMQQAALNEVSCRSRAATIFLCLATEMK